MQPLVLRLQLVKAGVDVVGHLRRGVVGLLRKGDEDAVFAVDLGVQLVGIVGDDHRGDVAQRHGLDAVHAEIQQNHVLQLLPRGDLAAHGDHIFHAALVLDVPGGHVEILRRQELADGAHGQHTAHIRLIGNGAVCIRYLLQAVLNLRQSLVQLNVRLGELGHGINEGNRS